MFFELFMKAIRHCIRVVERNWWLLDRNKKKKRRYIYANI